MTKTQNARDADKIAAFNAQQAIIIGLRKARLAAVNVNDVAASEAADAGIEAAKAQQVAILTGTGTTAPSTAATR